MEENGYDFHVTEVRLKRKDDNIIFGESVTKLSFDDEAGGLFLTITQEPNSFGNGGTVRFDFEEVDTLYRAIKYLQLVANQIEKDDNVTS
jgi:hypothetical protein